MKLSLPPCHGLLALALCSLTSTALFAQDTTPPVVATPISNVTVAANSGPTVINLKKTFALQGVTGKVARLSTSLGDMDIELDAVNYPRNVANFLDYANSGGYNNTFIHRGVAGFIFQGGGYHVVGDKDYPHIAENGTVPGEHKASNSRGTIAFALKGGAGSADSGTSEWFFNLSDNTSLDDGSNSQGPFTAFGRVIENGLPVMDAIGAVETYDASGVVVSSDRSVFTDLPLINYQSSQGTEIDSDLVYIKTVSLVPLTPKIAGGPALLTLKVKGNTNPDLITATITARKLTLAYAPDQSGSATITLLGKNKVTKTKVLTTFTVTVEPQR